MRGRLKLSRILKSDGPPLPCRAPTLCVVIGPSFFKIPSFPSLPLYFLLLAQSKPAANQSTNSLESRAQSPACHH
jgi:hypothetical protein